MSADDFKTVREVLAHGMDPKSEVLADGLSALGRIEVEVQQREAGAAAMREALVRVMDTHATYSDNGNAAMAAGEAALATDAGRAKLDELENAHASCRIERARAEKAEAERDEALRTQSALLVMLQDLRPALEATDEQPLVAHAWRVREERDALRAEVEATRAELQTECNHKTDVIQRLRAEVRKLQSLCLKVLAQWVRMADGEQADWQRQLVHNGRQEFNVIAAAIRALGDG